MYKKKIEQLCNNNNNNNITVQVCPAVLLHLLWKSHNVSLFFPSHHWWPSARTKKHISNQDL